MSLLESATQDGELVSFVLILISLAVLIVASSRTKTLRSFQSEMVVFALVLFAAEVPRILSSLGVLDISGIEDIGLEIHTGSMVFLAGFVAYRTYTFIKKG